MTDPHPEIYFRDMAIQRLNRAFRWLPLFLTILSVGCSSGTWIDDAGNFKRVFDFSRPEDVKVLHSYYRRSRHWTVEFRYFMALQPSPGFLAGLTDSRLVDMVAPTQHLTDSCGIAHPSWFLPRPIESYDAWISKDGGGYRLFRDKTDGTLFLCDERL